MDLRPSVSEPKALGQELSFKSQNFFHVKIENFQRKLEIFEKISNSSQGVAWVRGNISGFLARRHVKRDATTGLPRGGAPQASRRGLVGSTTSPRGGLAEPPAPPSIGLAASRPSRSRVAVVRGQSAGFKWITAAADIRCSAPLWSAPSSRPEIIIGIGVKSAELFRFR